MNINTKISIFFQNEGIQNKEIADFFKVSEATISNYLTGKRQMPLSFLLWFIEKYSPNLDKLFDNSFEGSIISEPKHEYLNASCKSEKQKNIDRILKDLERSLIKNL